MKNLKVWQMILIFAVVLVVAGSTYGIYYWVTKPTTATKTVDVQLIQVRYGNITNTVSSSGSLVFPISEDLVFGSAGTVAEVAVVEGETVTQGQLIAKFDDASLIPLQEAVVQASINLRDVLDTTQAEIAVTTAKIALETAQQNLEDAINPYSEYDFHLAELAVDSAEAALKKATEAFSEAKEKYDSNPTVIEWIQDYVAKQIQLAQAENTLTEAEKNLVEMKIGTDPLQVELRTKELAVAQVNLAKAEAELAAMYGTVTTLEGELLQLQIKEAQTALDTATNRLNSATILAPFNGVVTSVNISAGQSVSASTVVVEIKDPSVIEVSAVLDEIDVPFVQPGQRATVTLSSLSDLEITGEVYSISTIGKTQSGVVTYTVTIWFSPPTDIQLREGMSASADIVVEEATNILLVPTQAINSSGNVYYVQVMVNDEIEQRVVELGLSDGYYDEVVSGLQAGEQVVLPETTSSGTTQQNSQGIMFPGTGSFPGGGGIIIREEIR